MAGNRAPDARELWIEGWAVTSGVNRLGDVYEPYGAYGVLPLPLLLEHGWNRHIGWVTLSRVGPEGIYVAAQLKPGVEDLAGIWSRIVAGELHGLSLGVDRSGTTGVEMPSGHGTRYTRWNWVEVSVAKKPRDVRARITVATERSAWSPVEDKRPVALRPLQDRVTPVAFDHSGMQP